MNIVLATTNKGKYIEFSEELAPLTAFDQILTLADFPQLGEIVEDGKTFEENAGIKAQTVCDATGFVAIADDSGLCVEALNGEPGIFSARYSGKNATDEQNIVKLLEKMHGQTDRRIKFVCAIVCVFPDGRKIQATGTWKGLLTQEPIGQNGFGYDPVFWDENLQKTAAQMTLQEKNARSHRGKALRRFIQLLTETVQNT